MFQNAGASPVSIEGSRLVLAKGLTEGYTVKAADAEKAYTQALLTGTETWALLPEEAWPDDWFIGPKENGVCKYKNPVVRMVRALYGHPDAGTCWEQHSFRRLKEKGFEEIPGWRSCFIHRKYS